MSCRCHSYNGDSGETPEVVIPLPDFVQTEQQRNNTNVSVDACIAGTVKALWARGVVTLGSCCGHGSGPPDLVLGDNEDPERVAAILKEIDPRPWGLYQWRDGANAVRARVRPMTVEEQAAAFDTLRVGDRAIETWTDGEYVIVVEAIEGHAATGRVIGGTGEYEDSFEGLSGWVDREVDYSNDRVALAKASAP